MNTHFMRLAPEPFSAIESRTKIYELRLYDEKRKRIQTGDVIEFTNTNTQKTCRVRVLGLLCFASFDELYAALPLQELGYSEDELWAASPRDMEEYYSKEEQAQYGVVAIKLTLLD